MHKVVYEGLTSAWKIDGLSLMGKTGTAQIASPNGGYLTGEYDTIKSFAGIFPEDKPKYIVYAVARKVEGRSSQFAKVITTAIEEIAKYAKLTETTSKNDLSKVIKLENYISKEVNNVVTLLENKNISINVIGNGKYIIDQYPLKNTEILYGNKLFLLTNGDEITMPDMTNWSLNDVKTYCNLIGLKFEYSGYGYVKSQSIPPNTLIDLNTMTLSAQLE